MINVFIDDTEGLRYYLTSNVESNKDWYVN